MKNLLVLFFLLIIQTISFTQEKIIRGKLSNGLSYYIMENSKPQKRASLNLVIKSGSLNETENQRGLAHFLEHMAFNGTSEYPKNDLVNYLQSLGLSFGGDLNAHTGYDETVYKLQIPTDSENSLSEGVHVLRQWATDITLTPLDIENEKNIIMEEWRTAQGLTERLGKIRRKMLFGDSIFFERSPIGTTETILGANQTLLKDYYENWYHPELMAVIAVGDFDSDKIKNIIEKEFSYAPKKKISINKNYSLPENIESIKVFSDPELTSSTLEIFTKGIYLPGDSDANLLQNLKYLVFSNILNSRFSILEKRKETGFSKAYHYYYPFVKNSSIQGIKVIAKENKISQSLKEVLENLRSMASYPVSKEELSRELDEISIYLKNREINRDSIENEKFISEIRDEFLLGDKFISPKDSSLIFEKLRKEITPEEILKIANNFYKEKLSILASVPKNDNLDLIDSNSLNSVVKEVKNSQAKNLFPVSSNIFKSTKLQPGKILKKEVLQEYTSFQLSNGIDVLYKQTDFDRDKINMLLFREEGSSVLNYKDYINSLFIDELFDKSGAGGLNKEEYELFLKGKNYSLSSYISDYDYGFHIYSDKENISLALDNLTTLLSNQKFDSDILENRLKWSIEKSKNLKNSPKLVFSEK
ncbi:MAG: insulinase family protein, partial [Fusobacteriaceae bacterium]